jgi:hypothetical protein
MLELKVLLLKLKIYSYVFNYVEYKTLQYSLDELIHMQTKLNYELEKLDELFCSLEELVESCLQTTIITRKKMYLEKMYRISNNLEDWRK